MNNAPTRHCSWYKTDLIGALLLLLAVQCIVIWFSNDIQQGELVGTDTYMWLNRVQHLHGSGGWFEHNYPRINPPIGHEQHWARPFDSLLYAGAWLGAPLAGFNKALHIWGVIISPLLYLGAMLAIFWALAPLFKGKRMEMLGFLFASQPTLWSTFLAGRPDQQSLLALLFILATGIHLRLLLRPSQPRLACLGGYIAALALWVSMEALLWVLFNLMVLGFYWLKDRTDRFAKASLVLSLAMLLTAAASLLLEYGITRFSEVVYDRFSIVHITLLGLIVLFWWTVHNLNTRPITATAPQRLALALAGGVLVVVTMHALFPEFLSGPLAQVDALYHKARLIKIHELQPLLTYNASNGWQAKPGGFILYLGIVLPALPALVYLLFRHSGAASRPWFYLGATTLLYLPLAIQQIRWSGYVVITLLPAYLWLTATAISSIEARVEEKHRTWARVGFIALACFWYLPVYFLLSPVEARSNQDKKEAGCSVMALSKLLNDSTGLGKTTLKLLAETDLGPELLYRTRHSVLSIPNHRHQPGFTDTYRIMTATNDEDAKILVLRNNIDLILSCPDSGGVEPTMYRREDGGQTFNRRLREGPVPNWLDRLEVSEDKAGRFLVYRVLKHKP